MLHVTRGWLVVLPYRAIILGKEERTKQMSYRRSRRHKSFISPAEAEVVIIFSISSSISYDRK